MTTEGSGLSLEIVEGPGAGRLVPVHGALEIGRGTAAGLRLEDEQVSELHVRVSPADGVLLVQADALRCRRAGRSRSSGAGTETVSTRSPWARAVA